LQCEEKKTICCPFCAEDIPETKISIQQHIGTHMDEVALKSLPQHYEAESHSSAVSTPSSNATEVSALSFHGADSARESTNSLIRQLNSKEQTKEITTEVNMNEERVVLLKQILSDPDTLTQYAMDLDIAKKWVQEQQTISIQDEERYVDSECSVSAEDSLPPNSFLRAGQISGDHQPASGDVQKSISVFSGCADHNGCMVLK
jgi:hypothetical protein